MDAFYGVHISVFKDEAAINMPSLQLLYQVLRGFCIALPEIEVMGLPAAGMAMYLNEMAASFPCQLGTIFLHLPSDAMIAGCIFHSKVADTGEVSFEGYLGDKMKGDECKDAAFCSFLIDEEPFVRVGGHLFYLFLQEGYRPDIPADPGGGKWRSNRCS